MKYTKWTIEKIKVWIEKHHPGGELLSTNYKKNSQLLEWKCNKGHRWKAHLNSILNSRSWCPNCNHNIPDIKELQEFAKSKQGKLISTEYLNHRKKLEWECSEGHRWFGVWGHIKRHTWCPYCAKSIKFDIETLQKYAANKGGKLISTEYKNALQRLEWECSEGHHWIVRWSNIHNANSWCPKCASINAKNNIVLLQEHAISKGGKLISAGYNDNKQKLEWECSKGHRWLTSWNSMSSNNTWCPECARLKSEKECIQLATEVFNISFIKKRIHYDPNNKHKFIEFDGYNDEHKIAIEYNGIQHYKKNKYFHRTEQDFKAQQLRDQLKLNYCKENNIKLLIIPYNCKDIKILIETYKQEILWDVD